MTSDNALFSEMEFDTIGEILNISMGSAATAISSMLDRRVDITTPKVEMRAASEVYIEDLEPAFGVKITYVEGINGTNVMVLKNRDVNSILNIMTSGMLGSDPDGELDEMGVSAICEVMNQMMGAAATALSDFLGKVINISTPEPVAVSPGETFADTDPNEQLVMVNFQLIIEGVMESRFVSLMSCDLVQELIENLYQMMGTSMPDKSAQEPEVSPAPVEQAVEAVEPVVAQPQTPIAPQAPPEQAAVSQPATPPPQPGMPTGMEMQGMQTQQQMMPPGYGMPPQGGYGMYYPPGYGMPPQGYGMYPYGVPPQPQGGTTETTGGQRPPTKTTKPKQNVEYSQARPVELASFEEDGNNFLDYESLENLDLIRSVPLEISVEIGRATRRVKEILEFTQGTVVELDKQAGAQVDIIVNGQPIAKGDVVVIGDNFGVRITEILKREELTELQ